MFKSNSFTPNPLCSSVGLEHRTVMDYCHPGAPGSIPGEGTITLQEQITVLRICFVHLIAESVVLR